MHVDHAFTYVQLICHVPHLCRSSRKLPAKEASESAMMNLGSDDAMSPLAFSGRPQKASLSEAVKHEIFTAKDRT
jgi:hypothetical protein